MLNNVVSTEETYPYLSEEKGKLDRKGQELANIVSEKTSMIKQLEKELSRGIKVENTVTLIECFLK